MLSGLYGLLRPLDLMQPYRLEMGTKLANARGKDLYAFWGTRISEWLNEALADQGDDVLLNLASNEYFSAVKRNALKARIINTEFKDLKNGQYKIISFYAKKARGMMSRRTHQRPGRPQTVRRAGLSLQRRAVETGQSGVPARSRPRLNAGVAHDAQISHAPH
jgi:cytoplasmic iron level regulating protein YaaA (DUF328/UPF0246 family)